MTGILESFGAARLTKLVALTVLAVIASAFAVANWAANSLMVIPLSRPLGGPFYAGKAEATMLDTRFLAAGQQEGFRAVGAPLPPEAEKVQAPDPATLRKAAERAIAFDSIGSTGATTGAFWAESRGYTTRARRLIKRAVDLSRRDRMAQYWLMQSAISQGQFLASTEHLDTILRSTSDPSPELFRQFVAFLQFPEGRRVLRELVARDPDWITAMYEMLVANASQVTPVADLILEGGKPLRDGQRARAIYASLVDRLAQERSGDAIIDLYDRLPGADAGRLYEIALPTSPEAGYPPVIWKLSSEDVDAEIFSADRARRGAVLQISVESGHSGVAATKLFVPGHARSVRFNVIVDTLVRGSDARVIIDCLRNGGNSSRQSVNLFEASHRTLEVAIPDKCRLARLTVPTISGNDPGTASLTIDSLALIR